MRLMVVLAAALAVTGCATAAQNENARMGEAGQHAVADLNACVARLKELPAYQVVGEKLPPLGAQMIPLEVKANDAKPTPAEVQALIEFHRDGVDRCNQELVADAGAINPQLGTVMAKQLSAIDGAYIRLIKGDLSWGAFAQAKEAIQIASRAEYQQVAAQIKGQLQASHNAELARRQAALAAMNQSIQQQQMIDAMNRPRTTNCTQMGQFINCNSN